MDYIEVKCTVKDEFADIIIARMSDIGFSMFEEGENCVKAYIEAHEFNKGYKNKLADLLQNGIEVQFSERLIPSENWNAVWESNFEPVAISDKIYIRAEFHPHADFPYEIVIQPKMAFGTGHHATTSLMMENMLSIPFEGKEVLDMGCGTGILAILAKMIGAGKVTAVDNDLAAVENASENCKINNTASIKILQGDASMIEESSYDVLLANINRNIILNDIEKYSAGLKHNGFLILSGFYSHDAAAIVNEAKHYSLTEESSKENDNWVSIILKKSNH